MRDSERGAETQAEGEPGSCSSREPDAGLDCQNPGITPWTESRCSTTEPPSRPNISFSKRVARENMNSRGRRRSRPPPEQRVRYGAPSQNSGIMTQVKGRCLTDWATQAPSLVYSLHYLKRFYLFIWERDGEHRQTPHWAGPQPGFDPRTLRSWPELKADASSTEPPGCPYSLHFLKCKTWVVQTESGLCPRNGRQIKNTG